MFHSVQDYHKSQFMHNPHGTFITTYNIVPSINNDVTYFFITDRLVKYENAWSYKSKEHDTHPTNAKQYVYTYEDRGLDVCWQ